MNPQTDSATETEVAPRTHCIFCAADLVTPGEDRTDLGYCAFCREDEI